MRHCFIISLNKAIYISLLNSKSLSYIKFRKKKGQKLF